MRSCGDGIWNPREAHEKAHSRTGQQMTYLCLVLGKDQGRQDSSLEPRASGVDKSQHSKHTKVPKYGAGEVLSSSSRHSPVWQDKEEIL